MRLVADEDACVGLDLKGTLEEGVRGFGRPRVASRVTVDQDGPRWQCNRLLDLQGKWWPTGTSGYHAGYSAGWADLSLEGCEVVLKLSRAVIISSGSARVDHGDIREAVLLQCRAECLFVSDEPYGRFHGLKALRSDPSEKTRVSVVLRRVTHQRRHLRVQNRTGLAWLRLGHHSGDAGSITTIDASRQLLSRGMSAAASAGCTAHSVFTNCTFICD